MRNRALTTLFAAALLTLVASPALAAVLRVPTQYGTIQAALNAASTGDTILVAPGTYNEMLTWPSTDGIRLVSEGGFGLTTIDAQQAGRVITIQGSHTRNTVLEGFTITGGLMMTSRNHGAGLFVDSSPTIRANRITGNVGDGTSWNYGGGIHVDAGGNPLIEGNIVDANTLRNGSWNYGAGIYVDSNGAATIVGNQIRGNRNDLGSRGYGAGIYVGSGATATIVSNVIAGNRNSSTIWNWGGGIRIYSNGVATIANNTIADNTCDTGSNSSYGGGIEYSGTAAGMIVNNILARNMCGTGGGVRAAVAPTIDGNITWQNAPDDFNGASAGPNGFTADPMFQSATSYRLLAGSPCIDAGQSGAEGTVGIDFEGDPRRLDGDQTGVAGTGSRIDVGADEASVVTLGAAAPPMLGATYTLTVGGPTGAAWVLAISNNPSGNVLIQPFGNLLIGPPFRVLTSGATPGNVAIPLPNVPAAAGSTFYFQALVTWVSGPNTIGQLTRMVTATLF